MLIRTAAPADLPAVSAIYDHEVHTGVSTFDTEPRPLAVWTKRVAEAGSGDHLLVAERGGEVLGYASAQPYRPKHGYRFTRETAIYVSPAAQGQGVGRALYADLLARLDSEGVHLAVAAIALPNPASQSVHRASGFEPVGVMREVGHKFDRWLDTEWWQRRGPTG